MRDEESRDAAAADAALCSEMGASYSEQLHRRRRDFSTTDSSQRWPMEIGQQIELRNAELS